MRILKAIAAATAIAFGLFSVAKNANASDLRDAAKNYKRAVKQFEIAIYERGFDRHSKRLVQDLEEAAIRMRSAANQPSRVDRLELAWQEVQILHPNVESRIFGASSSCRLPRDLALERCWESVNCAYVVLAEAVACACNIGPAHSAGHGFPPFAGVPNRAGPTISSYYRAGSHLNHNLANPSRLAPNGLGGFPIEPGYAPQPGLTRPPFSPPVETRPPFQAERTEREQFRAALMQSILLRVIGGDS